MRDSINRLIDMWAEHQKTKPDAPEDYLVNVDHLRSQMDEWQRSDSAYRLLIGVNLANRALDERMKQ